MNDRVNAHAELKACCQTSCSKVPVVRYVATVEEALLAALEQRDGWQDKVKRALGLPVIILKDTPNVSTE